MQTVIDEKTGRTVRKASKAASAALKEHAHWLHHNPYRVNDGSAPTEDGAAATGDSPTAAAAPPEPVVQIVDAADAAAAELSAMKKGGGDEEQDRARKRARTGQEQGVKAGEEEDDVSQTFNADGAPLLALCFLAHVLPCRVVASKCA